jgi:hypothetical protein
VGDRGKGKPLIRAMGGLEGARDQGPQALLGERQQHTAAGFQHTRKLNLSLILPLEAGQSCPALAGPTTGRPARSANSVGVAKTRNLQ